MNHPSDLTISTGSDERNLTRNLPRNRRGPDARLPHRWSSPARTRVGDLDILPPELLQLALVHLDVATLMDFRLVNRHAAELVQSLPQFAAVTEHAAAALHGISCIGTGQYITLETLFETLCTANCECGDFGGYMYLVTCKRVCYRCVSLRDRYLPRERTRVLKEYGIEDEDLRSLPRMHILHGNYGPLNKKVSGKGAGGILFDTLEARDVAAAVLGSMEALRRQTDRFAEETRARGMERHLRWCEMAEALRIATPSMPSYSEEYGWAEPLRWVAVVRVPSLDRVTMRPEWGAACRKCFERGLERYLYHVLYTPEEFEKHWEECRDAEGMLPPPYPFA